MLGIIFFNPHLGICFCWLLDGQLHGSSNLDHVPTTVVPAWNLIWSRVDCFRELDGEIPPNGLVFSQKKYWKASTLYSGPSVSFPKPHIGITKSVQPGGRQTVTSYIACQVTLPVWASVFSSVKKGGCKCLRSWCIKNVSVYCEVPRKKKSLSTWVREEEIMSMNLLRF